MKFGFLTIAAICVVACASWSTPLHCVAAQDTGDAMDAPAASETSVESVQEVDSKGCVVKEIMPCNVCGLLKSLVSLQQAQTGDSLDAVLAREKQRETEIAISKCFTCCNDEAVVATKEETTEEEVKEVVEVQVSANGE